MISNIIARKFLWKTLFECSMKVTCYSYINTL